MGIGKRIKEARNLRGYTQNQLSEMVGVTPSAITNYENDISHPKEVVLYKLLEVLQVDANFLFQDYMKIEKPAPKLGNGCSTEKPATETDSEPSEINPIFNALDSDKRAKLLELARLYLEDQHKKQENG